MKPNIGQVELLQWGVAQDNRRQGVHTCDKIVALKLRLILFGGSFRPVNVLTRVTHFAFYYL